MKTLQNPLRNLYNRGKTNKAECDQMRKNNAKLARNHGLIKIHKTFTSISKC